MRIMLNGAAGGEFEQCHPDRSGIGSVCLLLGEFSSPNPLALIVLIVYLQQPELSTSF